MKLSVFLRTLSCILSLVILFCSLPLIAIAQELGGTKTGGDKTKQNTDETSPVAEDTAKEEYIRRDDPIILQELTEDRTANGKYFLLSDGSIAYVEYPTAVHYQDAGENWIEIDNTLSASSVTTRSGVLTRTETRLSPASSPDRSGYTFAASTDCGTLVSLQDGERGFSFNMTGVSSRAARISDSRTNTVTEKAPAYADNPYLGLTLSEVSEREKSTSSITYSSVFKDMDLTYRLVGDGLYEELWLNSADAPTVYTFQMELSGLTPVLEVDGGITLYDTETREPLYLIPAPYMKDSAGAYNSNVAVTLTESNGVWDLTLEADRAWLRENNRSYPVILIDPVVVISSTANSIETYIDSENPYVQHANFQIMQAGYYQYAQYESYWKLNWLVRPPKGFELSDAYWNFTTSQMSADLTIQLHRVTSAWDGTLTWYAARQAHTAGAIDMIECEAYQYFFIHTNFDDLTFSFDITDLYRSWLEDPTTNYGFCLRHSGIHGPRSYLEPDLLTYYSAAAGTSVRPRLMLMFTPVPRGIEEYYSLTEWPMAGIGTAYVNNATGGTTMAFPLVSTSNKALSYTPTLYCSQGPDYGEYSLESFLRMDWDQSLTFGPGYIRWTDADGTLHLFHNINDPDVYRDDDGLLLTLKQQDSGQYWDLSDGSNRFVFDTNGLLVGFHSSKDYALDFVRTDGKVTSIGFIPTVSALYEQLKDQYTEHDTIPLTEEIEQQIIEDLMSSFVEQLIVSYSNEGLLQQIANPYTGRICELSYTTVGQKSYLSSVSQKLQTGNMIVTVADVTFHYDSQDYVYQIVDTVRDYGWSFEPDQLFRVSQLNEYASAACITLGRSYSFLYSETDNETMICTRGADGIENTSDDLLIHHRFDRKNRKAASYITDVNNSVIYSLSAMAYEFDPQTPTNRVSQTYATETIPVNYLSDGSFEIQNTSERKWQNVTTETISCVVTSNSSFDPNVIIGEHALSLTSTVSRQSRVAQTVLIPTEEQWEGARILYLGAFGRIPAGGMTNNANALFGLTLTVHYTDLSSDTQIYLFDTKDKHWQYLLGVYVTEYGKTVDRMTVTCIYDHSEGTVLFDEVMLTETTGDYSRYGYNQYGRISSVTRADGTVSSVTYDGDSTLITGIATPNGINSSISYVEDTYMVDSISNMYVDANNHTIQLDTEYTYDEYNRQTSVTYKATGENAYLRSEVTYESSPSCWGYTATETASGLTASYSYEYGRLSSIMIDGIGVLYSYDYRGNMCTAVPFNEGTEKTSRQVAFQYDTRGRMTNILTPSTTYTFTYDAFDKLLTIAYDGHTMVTYTYAPNNGKLLATAYASGYGESYEYDFLDRLTDIYYTMNDVYDPAEPPYSVAETTTPVSLSHVQYDAYGRPVLCTDYVSQIEIAYTYNTKGQVLTATQSDVSQTPAVVVSSSAYTYDSKSRTAAVAITLPAVGQEASGRTYTYTYGYDDVTGGQEGVTCSMGVTQLLDSHVARDAFGRTETVTADNGAVASEIQYDYRTYNRVVDGNTVLCTDSLPAAVINSVSAGNACYALQQVEYTYDSRNRITGQTILTVDEDGYLNAPDFITYKYDNYDQLIRENNGSLGRTYVYTYDNAGNITSRQTYAYTTSATLPAQPLTTDVYTYGDATRGDLLTAYNGQPILYDAAGNPYQYRGLDMAWFDRCLMSVTEHSTQAQIASYTYDASGLRTSKTTADGIYTYLWGGDQLLRVTFEAAVGGAVTCADFLWRVDGQPYGFRYTDETGLVTDFYYLLGHAGDVAAVCDDTGVPVASFVYDAWGVVTQTLAYSVTDAAGSAVDLSSFRYRGYMYDSETGFYYLRSRYYDPAVGRFLSPDNIGNAGGSILGYNLYAYCLNNPVMRVDVNGELSFFAILVIAFFAYVVVSTVNAILTEVNYAHNSELEQPTELIDDQNNPDGIIASFRYGVCDGTFSTCEAIAIWNACKALGGTLPTFAEVIRDIQNHQAMLLFGGFGTFIYAVPEMMRYYGYKAEKVTWEYIQTHTEYSYIISYWDSPVRIHTVFYTPNYPYGNNNGPHVFNNEGYELESITKRKFIVAYRVYR